MVGRGGQTIGRGGQTRFGGRGGQGRGGQTRLCGVKGVGLQWVQAPRGNWVAPAGSYRSDGDPAPIAAVLGTPQRPHCPLEAQAPRFLLVRFGRSRHLPTDQIQRVLGPGAVLAGGSPPNCGRGPCPRSRLLKSRRVTELLVRCPLAWQTPPAMVICKARITKC
jgi:hypothetical protein